MHNICAASAAIVLPYNIQYTHSKLYLGIFCTTAYRMQEVLVQQVFYERTNSIAECLRVESISSHFASAYVKCVGRQRKVKFLQQLHA